MNKALSLDEQREVLERFSDSMTMDEVVSKVNAAGYHLVQYIGEDRLEQIGIPKKLVRDDGVWQLPSGDTIKMCVVHELMRDSRYSIPSFVEVGGFSVCRECLPTMVAHIRSGRLDSEILTLIVEGKF